MLAWAFHRISGVAIWAFILLHVVDIWLANVNPPLYDDLLSLYGSPIGRVLETALNGVRIIVMDFWPATTRYHKQIWYANWALFVVVGIPFVLQIMAPAFGLAAPFSFGG
jgi:succinate dehydrogenase / fumarate reductase cytochrome b subunit